MIKNLPAKEGDAGDLGSIRVRKIPCRQPTPVFLPGKSHGWRSLVGYNSRGRKELDRTIHARVEVICKYTPFHIRDLSIFGFWSQGS